LEVAEPFFLEGLEKRNSRKIGEKKKTANELCVDGLQDQKKLQNQLFERKGCNNLCSEQQPA
jgi:hypothetical protein